MKPQLVLAALASIAGCSKKVADEPRPAPATSSPKPAHQDESEHEELPTKVRLEPDVVRSAGIKTAPAVTDSLPATVDLTGEIAADPDRSARLAARVPGRIIDVKAKEGDRVKAGQTIAILESPELARARATLASATARAKAARLNADRLKNLEAKSLASGQEVAAAAAEAAALDAEVAAAKQTLSAFGQGADDAQGGSARVTIRTPLGGFVLSRDAVQGQTVTAEHVIATVGDLEHVYFLGRLFEKDLARVKVGASAEVRLNAYPDEVFDAKIETIGRQLDPAARTVTARIRVRNHGDLVKVGLFGTALVVVGAAAATAKHVVVPLSAVTRVASRDAVFVRQADGDFELHPVTVGRTAAGRVEILSGLRAGEVVVVDGAFTLKSAILKGTFGEEQ
ncbi:MAG TPA: efflux RND transporter periplasmic adaptor subunit [Polyangia bacterium]|jgi:cobalt-zinc-cadmium efflux system membrane fusion protein|nr:efflux RND transporter periplasmic adaptor subunit [Polyangia bacterium]